MLTSCDLDGNYVNQQEHGLSAFKRVKTLFISQHNKNDQAAGSTWRAETL